MDIKLKKLFLSIVLAALVATIGSAQADDTDVYLNAGLGLPAGSEPMVMFSLDYRPNLAATACLGTECDFLIPTYLPVQASYTAFDVLRGSLKKVFSSLEGVRVGLMLNHDQSPNCAGFGKTACSNGGYIAMGFELFEAGDTNGAKAKFHSILSSTSIPTPQGATSHAYQGKELFFEFFRYLTGQAVYNGHNGWEDYGTSAAENLDVDNPGASWATTGVESPPASKPDYISPITAGGACAKINTVNFMFQATSNEGDSDIDMRKTVALGGLGGNRRFFADVVQYLNDADLANGTYGSVPDLDDKQNVTSYFIVDPTKVNTLTTSYARAGGTGVPLELSADPAELIATLQELFKQILSVSTTFVAASVPVNVFNRAEITDNVYIALFQVDGTSKPYWVGNVKKLRLDGANDSTATAQLVDAQNNAAIASDGRIRFDALTYWSDSATLPPPNLTEGEVLGRDGRAVARGGAGQKVPGIIAGVPEVVNGLGGRQIYYDRTPSGLANFNVDSTTASALKADFGVATDLESATLIAYARGLDIDDDDGDLDFVEARDWIFGDALHSRPLPINFGEIGGYSATNPGIYIAVATNDGMLRMIRNTSTGGAQSGEEVWAFMPRVSMAAQTDLRNNGVGTPHPYTLDGAPVAYIQDVNFDGSIRAADGDKVYLYVGMRRGGKSYFALDITTPESPILMWTIDQSHADFAELGYTFSNPRVGLIPSASGPRPVVMFAGGYDKNKDLRNVVGSDDSEGNAIFVIDAETGTLIWKARQGSGGAATGVYEHPELRDSIPSALTVADTNGDGYTDRIVVGDTGGQVWRADLVGDNTANWKLSLLASIGRHAVASPTIFDDRRFFHRPDLVQTQDSYGLFDAVALGSGNRANPLDAGGITENFFYMIKDRQTAIGTGVDTGVTQDKFGDVTSNCLQTGSCVIDLSYGWKLGLVDSGEKVLATALTLTGKVFFSTYLPHKLSAAAACTPTEGGGRLYAVDMQDATSVINYDTSDDLPDQDPDGSGNSTNDRSVDLRSGGIPAEVVSVPPNKILRPDLQIDNVDVSTRWRSFWHQYEDADQ